MAYRLFRRAISRMKVRRLSPQENGAYSAAVERPLSVSCLDSADNRDYIPVRLPVICSSGASAARPTTVSRLRQVSASSGSTSILEDVEHSTRRLP